jgi:hypothetical protein
MNKLILLLILLITTISIGQSKDDYMGVVVGLDVRDILLGSPHTNYTHELNYQVQFILVNNDTEFIATYEEFSKLNFRKYSVGTGYHLHMYFYPWDKTFHTTFIPSAELALINRWDNWGGGISRKETTNHFSIGVNLTFRWDLNNRISLDYCFNMLPRTDLSYQYGKHDGFNISGNPIITSNFVKLVYKL